MRIRIVASRSVRRTSFKKRFSLDEHLVEQRPPAANKDGGAHVDSKLDRIYLHMIDGIGWTTTHIGTNSVGLPLEERTTLNPEELHFASLGQIAYEVLISPDILRLYYDVDLNMRPRTGRSLRRRNDFKGISDMTEHENIVQERVSLALQHLGLDPTNEESDGSTLQHKVTQKVVDRLLSLLQDGQSIYVDAAGNVKSIK